MTHDFLPTPASDNVPASDPQGCDNTHSEATHSTATHSVDETQKRLESFAAFDRWMDEKLDDLVAAWIHAAAPNASRVSRRAEALGR